MIEPTVLWTYVAIVAGFVFIPGPATLMAVARSTSSGTKAGVATACGVAVGDVIHTLLAIIGLSALILASSFLFTLVKIAGAAYLVYLGLRALFAKVEIAPGETIALSPQAAFRQAIVAELLNPKTALFFVAFLPQFVDPSKGFVALQLAVFGAILVGLGFVSTMLFALTAGGLGTRLRKSLTFQRWQNRVVGSIYCGLGARLALQDR